MTRSVFNVYLTISFTLAAGQLWALDDEERPDHDVAAPIQRHLCWDGVCGDRTNVRLVSNRSWRQFVDEARGETGSE